MIEKGNLYYERHQKVMIENAKQCALKIENLPKKWKTNGSKEKSIFAKFCLLFNGISTVSGYLMLNLSF